MHTARIEALALRIFFCTVVGCSGPQAPAPPPSLPAALPLLPPNAIDTGTAVCPVGFDEDPASRCARWIADPAVLFSHVSHAVRLLDGRVLALGALVDSDEGAALFDPAMDSWQVLPTGPSSLQGATATLLQDGRVLVVGGMVVFDTPLADARLFDPVDGSWAAAPPMNLGRSHHGAILRSDGKVWVGGGRFLFGTGPMHLTAETEVFDPDTLTWAMGAALPMPRSEFEVGRLREQMFVLGGLSVTEDDQQTHGGMGLYDPVGDIWMEDAERSFQLGHSATVLGDQSVLAVGTEGAFRKSLFSFWNPTAPMLAPRALHTSVGLADGTVLVAGGVSHSSTAEIYDPETDTWTETLELPAPLVGVQGVLLDDGRVLFPSSTSLIYERL